MARGGVSDPVKVQAARDELEEAADNLEKLKVSQFTQRMQSRLLSGRVLDQHV